MIKSLKKTDKENDELISQEQERLIKFIEVKDEDKVIESYQKIVQLLNKKLFVNFIVLDKEIDKSKKSGADWQILINRKKELEKDFKQTILSLAHQIDEMMENK